jgi:hypothetical protein
MVLVFVARKNPGAFSAFFTISKVLFIDSAVRESKVFFWSVSSPGYFQAMRRYVLTILLFFKKGAVGRDIVDDVSYF